MSFSVSKTTIVALAAFVAATGAGLAADVPSYIKSAVMDKGRPETDTARDAHRKPAEVIAFVGVKPGDKVGEIMPGRGYFTRILSKVVGPKGKVYGYTTGFGDMSPITNDPAYSNVVVNTQPLADFSAPEPLDVVWTTENYHDFHNPKFGIDMKAIDKKIFDALKPGGVYPGRRPRGRYRARRGRRGHAASHRSGIRHQGSRVSRLQARGLERPPEEPGRRSHQAVPQHARHDGPLPAQIREAEDVIAASAITSATTPSLVMASAPPGTGAISYKRPPPVAGVDWRRRRLPACR